MSELLKDIYDQDYVDGLARRLKQVKSDFKPKQFRARVFADPWSELELKSRMRRICESLHSSLDLPYKPAIALLREIAPYYSGYGALFFPDYVEQYGLKDWRTSLPALAYFTQYSSSEVAVRPFIVADCNRMMKQMYLWSGDDNYHVRRLASEGCRPRLPWAMALTEFKQDPKAILPILERLKADPEDYVRRSVANNLNDIAKDHPQTVLDLAGRWLGQNPSTDWIVKHGCRSLLKQAHPQALAIFGYGQVDNIQASAIELRPAQVKIGGHLNFSFSLQVGTGELGRLRVEYAIDYVKANGRWSRKVFKLSEGEFAEPERLYKRQQSFREMTTRKHYPGQHRLSILVNGVEKAQASFNVKA